MRSNIVSNISALSAAVDQAGPAIQVQQVYSVSAQAISTGASTGTVQLQVSNDPINICTVDANGRFVPVNWSSLGSALTVTAASTTILLKTDCCHQWLRAIYTHNNGSAGTITVNINTQGF